MGALEWETLADGHELRAPLAALAGTAHAFLAAATHAAVLTGGLTNRLYAVRLPTPAAEKWVVRVSGENVAVHFIDRAREFRCLQAAHAGGLTPAPLYHKEQQLLCQRLIEDATTLTNALLQARIPDCVALVRRLHEQPAAAYPGDFEFNVFRVVDHYVQVSRGHGAPLPAELNAQLAVAQRIQAALEGGSLGRLPLVPCHNDVLAANWIEGRVGAGAEPRLWLVDFEYGALGDRFFDLANFSVNGELDAAQDEQMLDSYFGAEGWGKEHLARVKLYKIVSDLREGLWSYVQWGVSSTCTPAFFADYGAKHLARFATNTQAPEFEVWLREAAAAAAPSG